MSFHFDTSGSLHASAYLATHPEAEQGRDPIDQYVPRSVSSTLNFAFVPPFKTSYGPLILDARPEFQSGQTFDAILNSFPGQPIRVRVDGLSQFSQLSVALIELGTGSVFDLHREQTFTLYPQWPESKYRIVIGADEYVENKQKEAMPQTFTVLQNYPNPFRSTTTIEYALPEATWIRFSVFDLLGREIATLFEGNHPAGDHTIYWDGRDQVSHVVPSGMYFVKVETDEGHRIVHSLIKMP